MLRNIARRGASYCVTSGTKFRSASYSDKVKIKKINFIFLDKNKIYLYLFLIRLQEAMRTMRITGRHHQSRRIQLEEHSE